VVVATVVTLVAMLIVVFARPLSAQPGLAWLAPVGRLAWPWYVPLGTAITLMVGAGMSYLPRAGEAGA
jgi:hypothetical protein